MTTTTKIAFLLVGVFALLATLATGWVSASDSPGSIPDRPHTFLTDEGGGASDIVILGDVNCDGVIDPIDALWILWLISGLIENLPCEKNADVNVSGSIDSIDAALILQFVTHLIGSLPAAVPALGPLGEPAVVSISSLQMNARSTALTSSLVIVPTSKSLINERRRRDGARRQETDEYGCCEHGRSCWARPCDERRLVPGPVL